MHSRNLNGKIIGIIDHHCNILDKTPEFYINEDTSSAAMIIYKLNKKILYNKIIASSYIQLYDYDYDKLKIMMNIVKDELWKDNIDLYVFLIYDMKKLITIAYFFSKKDINKIKFNKYISRKEVIFPIIERLYKNE